MLTTFPPSPIRVFRVGRRPDPWQRPSPSPGNRFDIVGRHPEIFSTYVAETPEGAYAETLADLRPSLGTIAKINLIPADPGVPPVSPVISQDWRQRRCLAEADFTPIVGTAADLTTPVSINALRGIPEIAKCAVDNGFVDVDEATLKSNTKAGRYFSQFLAAYLYHRGYLAIRYGSRHNSLYYCWMIYSHSGSAPPISPTKNDSIETSDPALMRIAAHFGLALS